MFLSKEYVLKKLNAALKKSLKNTRIALREAQKELAGNLDSRWAQKRVTRLEKQLKGFNSLPGIPFKPRKGYFEGNTSYGGNWGNYRSSEGTVSHGLNLETGRAHSYEWYDLGKIIKGTYVVNNYYYSSMTKGHYYDLCDTLKILGVKFVELEAPGGLQDLESAQTLQLERISEATMGLEYGKASGSKWRRSVIRRAEKSLETLSKFGIKTPQKLIDSAIETAREDRTKKLETQKQDRERDFSRSYERALSQNDLKKIVQLLAKNKRRMDKGLPSLIPQAA